MGLDRHRLTCQEVLFGSGENFSKMTSQTFDYAQNSADDNCTIVIYRVLPGGTVQPNPAFDAEEECRAMRNALKGTGTDEDAVTSILTRNCCAQRLEIAKVYKQMYGKDLSEELHSELSKNYRQTVLELMMDPGHRDAKYLRDAMKGAGTDEDVLIETLCTLNNAQIKCVRYIYKKEYGKDLETDIASDTSGYFRRILVAICNAERSDSDDISESEAQEEAQRFLDAGESKFGSDEAEFIALFARRSPTQLRAIFDAYKNLAGHSIEEAVNKECSGDFKKTLLAIAKCVQDKQAYLAERLYKSMKGLGTNDDALIRLIVSRCELDLKDIKKIYEPKYGESLEKAVKGDTSGDYKKILLALCADH